MIPHYKFTNVTQKFICKFFCQNQLEILHSDSFYHSIISCQYSDYELNRKPYISNLEVSDEGGYWDTGDRKELEDKMNFLNDKLNSLSASISSGNMGDLSNLSADEIADRIEKFFKENENQDDENQEDENQEDKQ